MEAKTEVRAMLELVEQRQRGIDDFDAGLGRQIRPDLLDPLASNQDIGLRRLMDVAVMVVDATAADQNALDRETEQPDRQRHRDHRRQRDAQLAAGKERRKWGIRGRDCWVGICERAGLAAVKRHCVGLAVTIDLDIKALGQRIDDGGADAVQTSGRRV